MNGPLSAPVHAHQKMKYYLREWIYTFWEIETECADRVPWRVVMHVGVKCALNLPNELGERGVTGRHVHLKTSVVWLKSTKAKDIVYPRVELDNIPLKLGDAVREDYPVKFVKYP